MIKALIELRYFFLKHFAEDPEFEIRFVFKSAKQAHQAKSITQAEHGALAYLTTSPCFRLLGHRIRFMWEEVTTKTGEA